MNSQKRKILVTCAFPYANGSLHLGHMLEHIQADIWVRYQKMRKKEIYFICADDAHGTAIMLKAQNLGISPETMIRDIQKEHSTDLKNFFINYDNYYSTHSKENFELLTLIYLRLKKARLIQEKSISQLYDQKKKYFYPIDLLRDNAQTVNHLINMEIIVNPVAQFIILLTLLIQNQ